MMQGLSQKKLSCFTLPEMVISLLLVSILFITALTVYTIISKQMDWVNNKNKFYTDYYLVRQVLKKDFEQTGTINITRDSKKLYFQITKHDKQEINSIIYLFDSLYIIRITDSNIDTLRPGGIITNVQFASDTLSLLRNLKVEMLYKQKPVYINLEKHYSSEEILKSIFQNNNNYEQVNTN